MEEVDEISASGVSSYRLVKRAVAPVTGRQGYLLLLEGCQAPRQVVLHHLSELQEPALSCNTVSHRAPLSSPLVLVSNRVVGEDRLTFVSLSSERVVL